MHNNTVIHNKEPADDTLKTTALLYLKEALEAERYEDCAELIASAKELGAQRSEIKQVINAYVRVLKTGRQNEANRNVGRRRF